MPPAIRNYVLLFVACLLFHLAGSWSVPLIDRDEPRFAEAAREMNERSDYVVPFFNNQFRFDKPPLTYWFQTASYRVFGDNDFAARFPSAIAAALVALVLFSWGTRLRDERSGWWAAIIFTLSLQTFVHGKAAVADMWLVLFVTLAHRAGYELLTRERKIASWWWTFYIALAFAFLAKGPIGWTPLLTIILAKRFYPNQKSRLQLIPGITLMLAFVCAWGIPALLRTHGEFFNVGIGKHVVARSFATMEGHGASSLLTYVALLPFYFVTLLASFFPWSIKLSALWKNLRSHCDAVDRFLLTGALIIFGIFTLVQTKLPHYTLPALPLLALLMAIRFHDLRLSRTLAISAAFNYLVVALVIAPFSTRFFPSYSLARDSERDLQPPMEFGAVGFNEPSLVWYFRKEIRGFMTTLKRKNAAEYMNKPGPRFIVLPTQTASELFPSPDPRWKSYRADGFNFAKGERTDLTLLLKAE